eukprot:gnl/TRDRNA2_/TRDRNA2_177258_c4_seq21.p1 gnl/TRDRNA2_/TRDRNA2_177258_c4~~gnl/TRDRNA2_/TRDRNA2_177258_c4_seq21.p1  ORF type:complete len:701 (+),score=241.17 gnl/TRDRNA2_/TRDRNA2_177258_c4_seq21:38-2140(+)
MKCSVLVLLLLAGLAAGAVTGSPVEKVVKLLTDLKTEMIADGEAEQKAFDRYSCWCETTTAKKAKAIDQAKADLRALGQAILKLKGTVGMRSADIAEAKDEIVANQKAQDDATAVRAQENTAYMAETTSMKEALASLQDAVKVLGDATGKTEFLQDSAAARERAAASLTRVLQAVPNTASLKQDQIALLTEFAASGASTSDKYAPQSASIQGILTDMYATFSANVQEKTQTEASKNRSFEDFVTTKAKQMLNLEASKTKKEELLAQAEQDLAQTTANYDDTEAQREADIEFFDVTKKACQDKSEEWSVRKEMREQELDGVEKALGLLTSDEARELFASSIKSSSASFLQVSSSTDVKPQQRAYEALKTQASETHSLRLASLAARVQASKTGHFDEVIHSIEDLKSVLKDEGRSDLEKRDTCKEQYQKLSSKMAKLNWKIEKNEAKIDKLEKTIALSKKEKAKAIEEIDSIDKSIEEMESERKSENEAFLNAKAEDEAAVALLGKTKDVLEKFYKENKSELGKKGAALIQGSDSKDQAPDATLSDAGSRQKQSTGIVQLISIIMEDLQTEIKDGKEAEAQAQLDFEESVKKAKALREDLVVKKKELSDIIAKKDVEKIDENEDWLSNSADLKDEEDFRAEIKPDCDFILLNFHNRAIKREKEMSGLSTAEDFLRGAQASLIATKKFDDDELPQTRFLHLSN